MNIKISDIQSLRKMTGCGMMDCQEALKSANGDIEVAKDILRKKGMATMNKKSGREANQGLIGIKSTTLNDQKISVICEINSETDFVANNDFFRAFFDNVLDLLLANPEVQDMETLMQLTCPWNNQLTLHETLAEIIGVIKENIKISKFQVIKSDANTKVAYYLHNKINDNLGTLGVMLVFDGPFNNMEALCKQLCMHIASEKPLAVSIADLDKSIVEKEREIYLQQLADSKKPTNIMEKIIDGKINKFYESCVLLEQLFIFDNSQKIKDVVKTLGENVTIKQFYLYQITQ